MTTETSDSQVLFSDLGLAEPVLRAVGELGYETPSPIQARIIPHVLAGENVLGQAQTGTGKTAAFALPLLSRLEPDARGVQALVLAPTRELALQVAAAFQRYAAHLPGFRALAVYGGQGYAEQLRGLRQGAQVVVGTPGRIMDHMRRGSLDLAHLRCLVLDEADEMLRMGFIEDVEWILEQTPATRQIALFSATMPAQVKRIAQRHLKSAAEVAIAVRTTTAPTIRQRYWRVGGLPKFEALSRILETEETDGVIIFVRTKVETEQLADNLAARGYAVAMATARTDARDGGSAFRRVEVQTPGGIRLGLAAARERNAALGMRGTGAFAIDGARSLFASLGWTGSLGAVRLTGEGVVGRTRVASPSDMLRFDSAILSTGFRLQADKPLLGGLARLGLTSPMAVSRAVLSYIAPVAYDAGSDQLVTQRARFSLAPGARQTSVELGWTRALGRAALSLGGAYSRNTANQPGLDSLAGWARLGAAF